MPTKPNRTQTVDRTPYVALQAASAIAREDSTINAPELARRVSELLPGVSKAACRRAADRVIDARTESVRRLGTAPLGLGGVVLRYAPSRVNRIPKRGPSLRERLDALRRTIIAQAFQGSGFRDSRVSDELRIELGRPVACERRTDDGWIAYGRQGHRRGIVAQVTTLRVPEDWTIRVGRAGLDNTRGLFTLDASPVAVAGPDGSIEVYRASWVRQGPGCSLVVDSGCLAIHRPTGETYHAESPDPVRASRGLARKLRASGSNARQVKADRERTRALRRANVIREFADRLISGDPGVHGSAQVSIRDSVRAGNCRPGTDSFADRYFPGRDNVSVAELAALVGSWHHDGIDDSTRGLTHAIATSCLVAIRRARRSVAQV